MPKACGPTSHRSRTASSKLGFDRAGTLPFSSSSCRRKIPLWRLIVSNPPALPPSPPQLYIADKGRILELTKSWWVTVVLTHLIIWILIIERFWQITVTPTSSAIFDILRLSFPRDGLNTCVKPGTSPRDLRKIH